MKTDYIINLYENGCFINSLPYPSLGAVARFLIDNEQRFKGMRCDVHKKTSGVGAVSGPALLIDSFIIGEEK